jgi:hypothetical protein
MKRIILILCFGLISACLSAPSFKVISIAMPEKISAYDALFKAVCFVESSNRPFIVNEKEQAYGIAQIRQIRLDDYNRKTNKQYKLEDCFNVDISKEIFLFYCTSLDYEKIAKAWNGSGKQTEIYWLKIQKVLLSL